MVTTIESGAEGRAKVRAGIDKAADAVKITLGPRGRNVTLDTNQYQPFPENTNDGVTILRSLRFEDPLEEIGLKLAKEVAGRADEVGDGTTTATVMLQSIIREGLRALGNGADAVSLRRGIETATKTMIEYLQTEALHDDSLETLVSVATISCGDAEIGKLVADCVKEAGAEGVVTLEDNPETETVAERLEGLKLRGSFTTPHFINVPERQQALYNNAFVFVTNMSLTLADEMIKIMEAAHQRGKKEVVIIANSIESDALATAIKNTLEKRFAVLPIRVLAYGDMGEGMLRDVAAITGATFFDGAAGMQIKTVQAKDLGELKKIVCDKHYTTVVVDDDDRKKRRAEELKAQIEATDREFEKESLRERIAKLNSAMFTIKVGGKIDTERTERRRRVEDAIKATRAALTDGVVVGGGSALYRAAHEADGKVQGQLYTDELHGYNAVVRAALEPIRIMAANSSLEVEKSELRKLTESSRLAIDFVKGGVVDGFEVGILDPVKVVISTIENAAAAAGLFLVTEKFVAPKGEQPEERL